MTDYDVLVVGAGIGGMESALKLGDMGYRVLLVEKEASVGGKMILLSKVFPTLDCASCISTPKMAASIHHPNVTTLTYSEVDGIEPVGDGRFTAKITQKARFVDEAACTGCQKCETACTVSVPDQFNADMVARHAAYIAFPQAVPKKAVIERAGSSPCSFTCPAGIQAHGYVSLIRSGEYEKAFQLVLDATPLVGTLGRACYAPCEVDCTRGSLEGPLPIRRLKRFIADEHYDHFDGPGVEIPEPNGHRVAIVGSGPAGLTAAWQLARKGYGVKIFEAAPKAGGFLRLAIPAYRLPSEVVERDIANVTALGVEIAVNAPVEDLEGLRDDGYDAVLVATGTPLSTRMGVPGDQLDGVLSGVAFLRAVKLGEGVDLKDRRVVVIGGGNVAMDTARTARRLGAKDVTVVYRRTRAEMPAHHVEADDTEKEGVGFTFQAAPVAVLDDGQGATRGLRCSRMAPGAPDASGRSRPEPVPGSEFDIDCDVIITAIGMAPDTAAFAGQVRADKAGRLVVDERTLQTDVPWLFAAGDVVTGASDITRATGAGQRAAFMIDRWIQDRTLEGFDLRLPVVDKDEVLARQKAYRLAMPAAPSEVISPAPTDFREVEQPMTEAEARYGAGLCLDCGVCSECGECVDACPVEDCIDLRARDKVMDVEVGAVVVATGFKLFAADLKPQYGFGTFKNVITGMQMDRLLAPTRPFNTILRPGRRQGPRADRLRDVHRLARRDRRQSPLFAVLLHVLDQAEPADHGRPAHRRRHGPLHGHPGLRQALRRVLRAGQGDGRQLRQGTRGQDHREGQRRPRPPLRGHRARGSAGRGRVRPGRPRGRGPAQQRRPGTLPGGRPVARRVPCTSPRRTRTRTRARPASRGSTSRAPHRAPRTSPTPSCTPGSTVAQVAAYLEKAKVPA